MKILYLCILAVVSYLIGNINFAKIISRSKNDDITKHGSGNPGTLNMLRTYGFKLAIFNMLLEMCKGAIPTLVGKLWLGQVGMYVAGVAVILGHIFPIIYKFKGGKGVAAFAGFSLIALDWWVFLIVFAVCFIFVAITSIGSIGTLGFVLISTIIQLFTINPSSYGWICYVLLAFITSIILFVHRGNIKRLFQGKENPTNIRKAFRKDFHLDDKEKNNEITEQLTEVATEEKNVNLQENNVSIKNDVEQDNDLGNTESTPLNTSKDAKVNVLNVNKNSNKENKSK